MTDVRVLYQGAEALIEKTVWHDLPAVCKHRLSKSYRLHHIDHLLITQRTKEEAKLMMHARQSGVSVPLLYDVDMKKGCLTMEYIPGSRVKDMFSAFSSVQQHQLCQTIGGCIARLHNNGVIHGDLTTSNMIIDDDQLTFIDFGLGTLSHEDEQRGVDLHVLMEAFESTHSEYPDSFKKVWKGYEKAFDGDASCVLQKIKDIIRRGRYR